MAESYNAGLEKLIQAEERKKKKREQDLTLRSGLTEMQKAGKRTALQKLAGFIFRD